MECLSWSSVIKSMMFGRLSLRAAKRATAGSVRAAPAPAAILRNSRRLIRLLLKSIIAHLQNESGENIRTNHYTKFTPKFLPILLRLCLKTRSGFERLIFRLTASGCIDDKTNIACFAVFARRKTARSRADDGVFRKSLVDMSGFIRDDKQTKCSYNVAMLIGSTKGDSR